MKVSELIEKLKLMPQDLEVAISDRSEALAQKIIDVQLNETQKCCEVFIA